MKMLILVTPWLILLVSVGQSVAADVPREPLDRLWEQQMLQGEGGSYRDSRVRTPFGSLSPFEEEKRSSRAGSPFLMRLNEYSIEVSDTHGTKLFGLLQGGGWQLTGGLLERIEVGSGTLELWGKIINRFHPGLWNNYLQPKEELTHEFFLVHRTRGDGRAAVVKKWTIQPEQVRWVVAENWVQTDPEKPFEVSDVRGFLRYDPATKTTIVTITGLKAPLEERVGLSGLLQ